MNEYNVGDKVRILSTEYEARNLTVGSVHEVVDVGFGLVMLEATYEDGPTERLPFYDSELEPYTEDNTAKIARIVRELNSALAESKDDMEVDVLDYQSGHFQVIHKITVTKKERIA